mmetsp:Transcript_14440/g.20167  ORF Transcript_14440/g.20167 Transcript_14440/m.20167 type:complete len:1019 (+) Transcript_14440:241-3297(+)
MAAEDAGTEFVIDILPGDKATDLTCQDLAKRLEELVADTESKLYDGVISRWIDHTSFGVVDDDLESCAKVARRDSKSDVHFKLAEAAKQDNSPSHNSAAVFVSVKGAKTSESKPEKKGFDEFQNPLVGTVGDGESSGVNEKDIFNVKQVSIPSTAEELAELLNKFPSDWETVWTISMMLRNSTNHGARNVGMSTLTLAHRKRLDMISGNPHLIRQHSVSSFLTLLSPIWRSRIIYNQLTQELADARHHGSALRASSFGTELALSAAVNSMDHLNSCLSTFLIEFTVALTPENQSEARIIEVNPSKITDESQLQRNKSDILNWCDKLVSRIFQSGKGSSDFQLVINALYGAVSKKFTPASTPRTLHNPDNPVASHHALKEAILLKKQLKFDDHLESNLKVADQKVKKSSESIVVSSVPTTPKHNNDGDIPSSILRLVGGFLFLRLLNPKLLQPSCIVSAPDETNGYNPRTVLESLEGDSMRHNLKLLCKVLMTSSNNRLYPSSSHLAFLNPWLKTNRAKMDSYLGQFCVMPQHLVKAGEGSNEKLSEFHERKLKQDLLEYLLLLLPQKELKAGKFAEAKVGIDELMPGSSREGNRRTRRILSETERKHQINKTTKVIEEVSMLVLGLEYVYIYLDVKSRASLTGKEFGAKYEVSSDEIKNVLKTPQCDHLANFTFVAHAPTVFVRLQRLFGVLPEQIMLSIATNLPYSDVIHSKKSRGAYMYSYDKRFIVKTQSESEFSYFLTVLKPYYQHIRDNKDSILARVLGLYEIIVQGKVTYWVFMANVCYGQQILHCRFDLKATNDRSASLLEQKQPIQVMKDKDFQNEGLKLAHAGGKVIQQLKNDIKWLAKHRIQGYRLFVGVYVERTLESQRQMFRDGHYGHYGLLQTQEAWALNDEEFETSKRLRILRDDILNLCLRLHSKFTQASQVGEVTMLMANSTLRESMIFHGIPSTPVKRKGSMRRRVVYIGIIDIMREYNTRRKLENFWRGTVKGEGDHHSAIAPKAYGQRMIKFVHQHLRW